MGHFGLPYHLPGGPKDKFDYTAVTYDELLKFGVEGVSEDQWNFFRNEFTFLGGFQKDIFLRDLRYMFNRLLNAQNASLLLVLTSLSDVIRSF